MPVIARQDAITPFISGASTSKYEATQTLLRQGKMRKTDNRYSEEPADVVVTFEQVFGIAPGGRSTSVAEEADAHGFGLWRAEEIQPIRGVEGPTTGSLATSTAERSVNRGWRETHAHQFIEIALAGG